MMKNGYKRRSLLIFKIIQTFFFPQEKNSFTAMNFIGLKRRQQDVSASPQSYQPPQKSAAVKKVNFLYLKQIFFID